MPTINAFSKQYYYMMTKGFFSVPTRSYSNQHLVYHTNKPFRLCLVAEITDLHFMLYAPQRCDECDPEGARRKLKSPIETLEYLFKVYDPGEVRTATSFFAMIHGGKNYLPPRFKAIWNAWLDISRNGYVDWDEVMKAVDLTRKTQQRRFQGEKQSRRQRMRDLIEDLSLEKRDPEAYKAKLEAEKAAIESKYRITPHDPQPPTFDDNPNATSTYNIPEVDPDFSGTVFEKSQENKTSDQNTTTNDPPEHDEISEE
jgi:hypothetical protein